MVLCGVMCVSAWVPCVYGGVEAVLVCGGVLGVWDAVGDRLGVCQDGGRRVCKVGCEGGVRGERWCRDVGVLVRDTPKLLGWKSSPRSPRPTSS